MTLSERRLALTMLGLVLLCTAVIMLAPRLMPGLPGEVAGQGYIGGVLSRSLTSPYQLVLLAGWAAVLLQAIWLWMSRLNEAGYQAYDGFAYWLQTIFSSLGFLGTIIGVSIAVGGLEEAMENQETGQLVEGLSTAFDTTFLGLGAALTLMFIRKLSRL